MVSRLPQFTVSGMYAASPSPRSSIQRAFGIAALLASLAGANIALAGELSKRDCRAGDWHKIGYADGRVGIEPHAMTAHTARCESFGLSIDAETYLAGWADGIAQFCTEESGFEAGAQGARYANPCPTHLTADFRDGYQTGRQVHLAESEIAELEAMVLELSRELTRITDAQDESETHLVLDDGSATDRYRWLEEIKFLARERAQTEGELNSLDLEIESRKEHLELLRTSIASAH